MFQSSFHNLSIFKSNKCPSRDNVIIAYQWNGWSPLIILRPFNVTFKGHNIQLKMDLNLIH